MKCIKYQECKWEGKCKDYKSHLKDIKSSCHSINEINEEEQKDYKKTDFSLDKKEDNEEVKNIDMMEKTKTKKARD